MSTATLPVPTASQPALLTTEEFLARYGDTPADLVKGKIVEFAMPGGVHGKVCLRVAKLIDDLVQQKKLGHVFTNDTHVKTRRNPDSARGMDVGYVSYSRLPKDNVPEGALEVVPELVFEVRSPSDRWSSILGKVIDYLDLGVDVVIVLDPKTTSATLFRQDDRQETLEAGDTLTLPAILPGFAANVAEFFG
jgi:Uma2 family endonuclease